MEQEAQHSLFVADASHPGREIQVGVVEHLAVDDYANQSGFLHDKQPIICGGANHIGGAVQTFDQKARFHREVGDILRRNNTCHRRQCIS